MSLRKSSPIRIFRKTASLVMNNGGKVVVTYVQNGKVQPPVIGRLKNFNTKSGLRCVDLDVLTQNETFCYYIPTLGNCCAVQKVTDENGRLLYRNRAVGDDYGAESKDSELNLF